MSCRSTTRVAMRPTSLSLAVQAVAIVLLWLPSQVVGQEGGNPATDTIPGDAWERDAGPYEHPRDAPVATAVRIDVPLSIDGRLDEPVWMTAPAISDFRQTVPNEGAPVSQRTEIRFLYDNDAIYVGAWLWDTGEILSRLARRDAGVPDADFFVVLLDTYHDHRTAYRFSTSPAAMKRDEIVTDGGGGGGGRGGGGRGGGGGGGAGGGFGDTSWDPIWDVRTSITDEGWFVEMRIPFSQLRYSTDPAQVWGLQVERKIRRYGEDTVWAFSSRNERGGIPRFGHLVGIENIPQGKRLEVLPYVGARAEYTNIDRPAGMSFDNPFRSGSDYFGNAGADLKYRLSSNLTLDATVNPDFGQVELDPSVINLTAFETRFDEKRPFFVEGADVFRFGGGGMGGPQLLYSRRIGRAPQGSVPTSAAYSDVPTATTILGAGKVTGKTASGWSLALLDAVTGKESATHVDGDGVRSRSVVEPLTNYLAGRLRRDIEDGSASYGVIATGVHRRLESDALRARLRSSAYSFGLDGRRDLFDRTWTISTALASSYIAGDASAIALTQRSSARYFQRPDASHLSYDPGATSMRGMFGRAQLSKNTGDWRANAAVSALTPGFEINDVGFQTAADRVNLNGSVNYDNNRPGRFRSWGAGISPSGSWNFAGQSQQLELSANASVQLLSFHNINVRTSRQFSSFDDRLTRGGPTGRSPGGYSAGFGLNTDSRRLVQLRSNVNFGSDESGGWGRRVNAGVTMRFRGIYEVALSPEYERSRTAAQYVGAVADANATDTFGFRYVFAALDQTTVSLQTRFNATFTPDLSLELYAEPLLSSGNFGPLMEFAAPGTFSFREFGRDAGTVTKEADGRYLIDPDGDGPAPAFRMRDPDFDIRSLLGSAVLRWEWSPGSTLFLVWQQARSDRLTGNPLDVGLHPVGRFDFRNDATALLDLKPDNIFLVKISYWFNP
jgi:hypothetical protein